MSFSQISSYVGASWRLIGNREMSEWNVQAATTREIYLLDLGKYKQTAEYKEYQNYLVDFRLKNFSSHQRLNQRSTSRRSSNVTNGGLEGSASFNKGWLPLMNTSAFPQTQPQEHNNSSAKVETPKCTYCGYCPPIETPPSSTLPRHLSKTTHGLEGGSLPSQLCLFDLVSDYTR
jgi:hypothetical protein